MRPSVVVDALSCPRCAASWAAAGAARGGSAFSLYCRRCKTRLVAAAPEQDDPRAAVRYGGVTFGPAGEVA